MVTLVSFDIDGTLEVRIRRVRRDPHGGKREGARLGDRELLDHPLSFQRVMWERVAIVPLHGAEAPARRRASPVPRAHVLPHRRYHVDEHYAIRAGFSSSGSRLQRTTPGSALPRAEAGDGPSRSFAQPPRRGLGRRPFQGYGPRRTPPGRGRRRVPRLEGALLSELTAEAVYRAGRGAPSLIRRSWRAPARPRESSRKGHARERRLAHLVHHVVARWRRIRRRRETPRAMSVQLPRR